jgi:phosphotriesterase-related protein
MTVMTVAGPTEAAELGITLPHEHVMVDFIGADLVSPDRYDRDQVVEVVLPHLADLRGRECKTLVECTPSHLGRDPVLLRRLAAASELKILTNTGYYGADNNRYLPHDAVTATADDLAELWSAEARDGIEDTGIRPGFIKIAVDPGPLSEVHEKLVRAAARTHLATGLTIASHTPDGIAAGEQLAVLGDEGVDPSAWIWVHAQLEPDSSIHERVAEAGAWIEFDGIAPDTFATHVDLVLELRRAQLTDRVLLSHDAGWYAVGEVGGGSFRPYDTLFGELVPTLREAGLSDAEVERLLVTNPAGAFSIAVRT